MGDEIVAAHRVLEERLAPRPSGWMDILTGLHHFALINYALPASRLRPHVHERFEIETFDIGGTELALMSVVPFEDAGFHFLKLPFVRFHFCQTNYRIYVIDRETGERVVWFFGTTLGSWTVRVCRWLWKIPWHSARYKVQHEWDEANRRYAKFRYEVKSKWAPATMEVRDTGQAVVEVPGFNSHEEMMLCLTHPVLGYYHRLDGTLGSYSVSHDLLEITAAEPVELYFGLFERLGILSRDAMMNPHSIFVCPKTEFHIYMPPFAVGHSGAPGS